MRQRTYGGVRGRSREAPPTRLSAIFIPDVYAGGLWDWFAGAANTVATVATSVVGAIIDHPAAAIATGLAIVATIGLICVGAALIVAAPISGGTSLALAGFCFTAALITAHIAIQSGKVIVDDAINTYNEAQKDTPKPPPPPPFFPIPPQNPLPESSPVEVGPGILTITRLNTQEDPLTYVFKVQYLPVNPNTVPSPIVINDITIAESDTIDGTPNHGFSRLTQCTASDYCPDGILNNGNILSIVNSTKELPIRWNLGVVHAVHGSNATVSVKYTTSGGASNINTISRGINAGSGGGIGPIILPIAQTVTSEQFSALSE